MTITDELFWAAARAGIDEQGSASIYVSQDRFLYYGGFDLRAALEAAAPAIRKAALEEAEARIGATLAAQRDRWEVLMQGYLKNGMKEAASAANHRRAAFNHAVSIVGLRILADKEGA